MITRKTNGLEFPLLENLVIKSCNNMKIFCSGAASVATAIIVLRFRSLPLFFIFFCFLLMIAIIVLRFLTGIHSTSFNDNILDKKDKKIVIFVEEVHIL